MRIMIIFIVICFYVMYNSFLNYSGNNINKANAIVSGEGEGTEEARNVVVSEKEGNIVYLSRELIMESVGSPE